MANVLGNEWISLPDLVVNRSDIAATSFGRLFTTIILKNGYEVKTVAGRRVVQNLLFDIGDKVNGKLIIRGPFEIPLQEGEDNGQ